MAAQLDPGFLVAWVRAEVEDQPGLFDALCTRAQDDGLNEEEAEVDVAGQLAERRGLLDALERAAGELWLSEVREARGATEKLERSGPACVAWLRASPGAASRLELLSKALLADPGKSIAELDGTARWTTTDRCAGTSTNVAKGSLTLRERRGGRRLGVVRAGHERLVRARLFRNGGAGA